MTSNNILWHEIGQYIVNVDERNIDGIYTIDDVRGLSIDKKFIPTKANMEGVSLKPYKIVRPGSFCYVTVTSRNSEKLTLAYNDSEDTYLVSSSYEVFRVSDIDSLSPEFLFLWFVRPEFNRYSRFHSWGSARETFSFEEMKRVQIPIPSIEKQLAVVDAWKSLRRIKEENEALAAPLLQLCQSYIQGLKKQYECEEIGPYIEEVTRTNTDGLYGITDVRGVSNDKTMRDYKGSLTGRNMNKFLLIEENEFVFNKRTNAGMGLCLVKNRPFLFTEDYEAFRVNNESKLLPDYLYLFFTQKDFDRYIAFNSWGSSVVFFHIADMRHFSIPIPPVKVQRAIVAVHKCALEYKLLACLANNESHHICSALLQHVINN